MNRYSAGVRWGWVAIALCPPRTHGPWCSTARAQDIAGILLPQLLTLRRRGLITQRHTTGPPEWLIPEMQVIARSTRHLPLAEQAAHPRKTAELLAEAIEEELRRVTAAPALANLTRLLEHLGMTVTWTTDQTITVSARNPAPTRTTLVVRQARYGALTWIDPATRQGQITHPTDNLHHIAQHIIWWIHLGRPPWKL